MGNSFIRQLESMSGIRIECPSCNEEVSLKRARLFNMYDAYPANVRKLFREQRAALEAQKADLAERNRALVESRKQKPLKISTASQASNFGQISEQILPAFTTFPYKRSDCRILFKPIDYLVFPSLSNGGLVSHIKFVDVKTGDGRLDKRQKQIRDRVQAGRIRHKVID